MISELKTFLKRVLKKDSKENQELTRLRLLPRYTLGETYLLKNKIIFPDAASFLFTYEEIFLKEIYKFKVSSLSPVIIDAGANIGLSTIYFKMTYPNAEVMSFEPDGIIFDILKKNIQSFNLKNVNLIRKACWDEETTLSFYSEGADGGRKALSNDVENIIKVDTIRLRDYLSKEVDLLKIDIEGSEYTVLKDCKDVLKNVKLIFLEYHSFINQKQNLAEVITILENAGFRIHVTSPSLISKQPFIYLPNYANMDNQLNIYGIRE